MPKVVVEVGDVIDQFMKYDAEIKRLRSENKRWKDDYFELNNECLKQQNEIERLREALKQVGLYAWQGDTFKIMDIVRETIIGKEK